MLKLKHFKAHHLNYLQLRPEHATTSSELSSDYGQMLESASVDAASLFLHAECLACWGLIPVWTGVGEAWSLMSARANLGPLLMIKSMRDILENSGLRRIHTSVLVGYAPARRLLELLEFKPEGRMSKYDTQGRDHIRYARIL